MKNIHIFQFIILLVFSLLFSESKGQALTLDWANAIGSTGNDDISKIQTDQSGNVYCIGSFTGYLFDVDPGPGTQILNTQGYNDGFISKYSANGNLIWSKALQGSAIDYFSSLIIDNNDQIFLTGTFSGPTDLDFGSGTFSVTPTGTFDFFMAKYDTSLNLQWAKTGNKLELESMHVDENGNIYLFLFDHGTADFDFGTGSSVLTGSSTGSLICSVAKYDPSGNFIWAKSLNDYLHFEGCVVVSGEVLILADFDSIADFDPGIGTFNLTSNGGRDISISKLDSSGNFLWAKQIGGPFSDAGWEITTDKSSNIILALLIQDTVDIDPGILVNTHTVNGLKDFGVLKLDPNGDLMWPAIFDVAEPNRLFCDADENIYVSGIMNLQDDVDPGPGVYQLNPIGMYYNNFMLKLFPTGHFITAFNVGSDEAMLCCGPLHVSENSEIYFGGAFQDTTDFDPGTGIFSISPPSYDYDVFLVKLHDNTTGNAGPSETDVLEIFPNPASENIHFKINNTNKIDCLEISDLAGKTIYGISGGMEGNYTIQVSNWNPGMYFAKITVGTEVYSQKFIVTHLP